MHRSPTEKSFKDTYVLGKKKKKTPKGDRPQTDRLRKGTRTVKLNHFRSKDSGLRLGQKKKRKGHRGGGSNRPKKTRYEQRNVSGKKKNQKV